MPAGTSFVANDIYEFSYIAKDPTVNGLGFAAIRDWNAFLKYETKDDAGTANPMAGDITRIYTETSSQPARLLNDFRNLGFNQAENGKKVFDGMMQWIAAGDGINMNYRFSQPGRTERNRQDHLYVEGVFPFANVSTKDPLTGKTASRYDACMATNTCPLAVEIYSANEYWVKAASLLHTDPAGKKDLPDSPFTRNYFMSSHQHGLGNATTKGSCQAAPESARLVARAARAVHRVGRMVNRGHAAAAEPGAEAVGRNVGAAAAANGDGLPQHSGRGLQRPENDPLPVQLRT